MIIRALQDKEHAESQEISLILAWSFHFDVMSQFSLRHWRTELIKFTVKELAFFPKSYECGYQCILARTSFARQLPYIKVHAHPITQLLARVFETNLYSSDPQYHTVEYQQSLDDLSHELETATISSIEGDQEDDDIQHMEIARLAALVYHERVSRNFSGHSDRITTWITKAHATLRKVKNFPCFFALFVIGCETHEDEERVRFLDFFARLEEAPHLNRVTDIKGLIQSAWIQHDLASDEQLEYLSKINLVLSSRNVLPSFM